MAGEELAGEELAGEEFTGEEFAGEHFAVEEEGETVWRRGGRREEELTGEEEKP